MVDERRGRRIVEDERRRQLKARHRLEPVPQLDGGERVVVGVNKYTIDDDDVYEPLRVDPALGEQQATRLAALRADRNQADVTRALDALKRAAEGSDNVMPFMREALVARTTCGEVCHALRDVWGVYVPADAL